MTEIQIRTDVPDEAADIISAAIEGALKKQHRNTAMLTGLPT